MLREILHVRQVDGEPRRRWFQSLGFDLVVWYDDRDRLQGFQLCYSTGPPHTVHALTWNAPDRYRHMAVDDGEGRPFRHKATPILIPDGIFDAARVTEVFLQESAELPPEIVALVAGKLREHPEENAGEE